jgi:hypothetical protein
MPLPGDAARLVAEKERKRLEAVVKKLTTSTLVRQALLS